MRSNFVVFRSIAVGLCLAVGCFASPARGDEAAISADGPLSGDAAHTLFKTYCVRCHNAEKHEGDIDLTGFGERPDSLVARKRWNKLVEQLESQEMPPEEPLPTEDERRRLIAWAKSAVEIDWSKVRDPGHVTIPRLTREEYNHTLRDLLGLDTRPGDAFSADGEGASGFNTDRDALFLTPALMEQYLAAAASALDAVAALEHEPMLRRFESEDMFMTETRERPRDFGDGFNGYVLNRGQMTLYDSINFPHDGFYTFTIRARNVGGPSGALVRLDNAAAAAFTLDSAEPRTLTATAFVKHGSRQMAWNIDLPARMKPGAAVESTPAPKPNANKSRAAAGATPSKAPPRKAKANYKPLPENANALVDERSGQNAMDYELDAAASLFAPLANRVRSAAVAVQRPYEWLRLLGAEGNPSEIARFKGYIDQRAVALEEAKARLAEALGETPEQFDARFNEQNAERLADQRRILEAVSHIAATPAPAVVTKAQVAARTATVYGSAAIDWIEVRGPIHPAGEGRRALVFSARPGPELSPRDAARRILKDFLPRAFRRPVGEAEIDRYLALFDHAAAQGEAFEPAVKLALVAVLVSPHFLYRNEFGPIDGEYRLDDYQLASRLSYFLWMSMPDEELFALARAGRLRDAEVLSAQVDRMLADPKSRDFVCLFLGQWLGFASLGQSFMPDTTKFPEFDDALCQAMKAETVLVFESLLLTNGSLLELIDSRETWLNAPLARLYGIGGVTGDQMRRVRLDDANRGGLLGMASVLTATSSATRTNPVIRGRWVLETLLGEIMPEPPADAGTLDPEAGEARGKTLRDELLAHRRDQSCAACHDRLDPVGFGLEVFDAIGRYRATEAGRPVDSTGRLPSGTEFSGAAELKRVLAIERRDDFIRNLSERMLSFALGRRLELYDQPALDKITAAVEADGHGAATLIKQVALSFPFQYQNNRGREE